MNSDRRPALAQEMSQEMSQDGNAGRRGTKAH